MCSPEGGISEQGDSEAPRVGPAPQHALDGEHVHAGVPALSGCQWKVSKQAKPWHITKHHPSHVLF